MRKALLMISVLFLVEKGNAQPTDYAASSFISMYSDPFQNLEAAHEIDLFLSASEKDPEKLTEYKHKLDRFINKQDRKRQRVKDDHFFLKNLFFRVHNKFLRHYKNYVSFDGIFANGSYDCVTGTALYALILDELGFDLHIYESNFHVFLLVDLPEGDVLIESTDFYTGYVDDENQIASRVAHYQLPDNASDKNYYTYQSNNNRFINARQLAGLLYFNLAVDQYNNQNFDSALAYLERAENLYASKRMLELKGLIGKMIFASNPY